MKRRIVIDVQYRANKAPGRDLEELLEAMIDGAVSKGLLTKGTKAVVKEWECRVLNMDPCRLKYCEETHYTCKRCFGKWHREDAVGEVSSIRGGRCPECLVKLKDGGPIVDGEME